MDRKEAAEFLGISLRTLDRLVAKGCLTKGRALRKTKPIVVFRRDELAALKEALSNKGGTTAAFRQTQAPKDAVAFRIDPHYLARLTKEGAPHDMSPGEYARRLVIQSLEQEPNTQFAHELRRLRESLAAVFFALLTTSLGVPPEEARRLVDEAILRS